MPPAPKLNFSELLLRADLAGVVRLPSESRQAIADSARSLGFFWAEADLSGVRSKEDFLAAIAEAMYFPAWFGENWDALGDCLVDMSWSNADGYVLLLLGADQFHAHAPDEFLTALAVLSDASATWAHDEVPFWVFVDQVADGLQLLKAQPD
ncbi:MAG: barstar family protein [Zoogloeaceae bacterium]|nr:barstar family protein [Zoogloeaceae bacterium]